MSPELTKVEDFGRLAVVVRGTEDRARLDEALAGWGSLQGDHVWIEIAALERELEVHPNRRPGWSAECTAMVGYADSKGWVGPDRRRVRSHCQWID